MTLKLNLGSGVFPFPLDRERVPNAEHLEPLPATVFEPGWVNVDKFQSPGVQEKVDLFRFPWVRSSNASPWNDNSVDCIWAAHIIEHIPHAVRVAAGLPGNMAAQYRTMCDELDGFFVFFAECWRILKPGGLMHIRFPYATSYASLNDPTHTRYMTMGTFGYLAPKSETAPFDYQVPCHFELDGEYSLVLSGRWPEEILRYSKDEQFNMIREHHGMVREVRMTLRAVKGESQ